MCIGPAAPILGLVMGIGQAIVGAQAANQDFEAKQAAYNQNVVNAQASARDEQRQIVLKGLQEGAKTAQAIKVHQIEDAKKTSTAVVNAAAGGVSGMSVENIVNDLHGTALKNETYAAENYKFVAADLTEQLKGTETRQKMRIDSMQKPVEPNPLVPLLGIAGAGVKFAGSMA